MKDVPGVISEIERKVRRERRDRERDAAQSAERPDYSHDPVGYMRDPEHGLALDPGPWPVQEEIAQALLEPPYKVAVPASHSVGKTWLAAALTSWHYDTFDDSVTITTAPTYRDVVDLLWSEVRRQRTAAGKGGFRGTNLPELWDHAGHYAKGYTAERGESFQGRHFDRMGFVFDEAVGVDATFWTTTSSMFKPNGRHWWLTIFNPTDTSSQAYREVMSGGWRVITMSALDHPNLLANPGMPLPYPAAVDAEQFSQWVKDWCDPIAPEDRTEDDIEWPRGSGCWYRPGPDMEARGLGRWPSAATFGVWSEALWKLASVLYAGLWPPPEELPELGVDLATFGDDYSAIHGRWGPVSLHHERHNGWLPDAVAGRAKLLCADLAERANRVRPSGTRPVRPEEIPVKFDSDGNGGGFLSHAQGYRFLPVSASARAIRPDRYPNRRSELWFGTAERARRALLDLSRLSREHRDLLRQQLLAPRWAPDGAGLRTVERKLETKKRLKCSPDDADALNLAYTSATLLGTVTGVAEPERPRRMSLQKQPEQDREPEPDRRRLFGR